jgi:site-specific recombinase XerD
MAKYNFNLRSLSGKGEKPIYLIVRWNNLKIVFPTKLTINPNNWNSKTQRAVTSKKFPIAPEFNFSLDNIEKMAKNVFRTFENDNKRTPNVIELRKCLDNEFNEIVEPEKLTLIGFIEKVIEEAKTRTNDRTGKTISVNTIKIYKQCLRLLKEFNKSKRKIDFVNIDLDFFHDFKEFLLDKAYSQNTIAKHIITLKSFLNEATEREINTYLAYKSKRFRVPQVAVDTIYLDEKELNALYNLKLQKEPTLERVRDLFLVGCYTGLRYSDWSIKPEDIKGDFIEITTEKTNERVVIPIHPTIKAIMKRYEGKYPNSLPPTISNQNMNLYLKQVCEKIEALNVPMTITQTKGKFKVETSVQKYQRVSTHTARRSFATNLYKEGVSPMIIMKITGHRTEKAFLKYIRVTPKENAKLLQLHWNKKYSLKIS